MRPLYHILDPLWSRFPFPSTAELTTFERAGVEVVQMSRRYRGRALMDVRAYRIGDTLFDTGLAAVSRELVDFARARGVRRALLTHHHEDHSGGTYALLEAGAEVFAGDLTSRILRDFPPIPFHQHLVWGRARSVRVANFPDELQVDGCKVEVVPVPGHAVDQVAFHLPERGIVLSGDAFIHENVRLLRGDEDYRASLASVLRLLELRPTHLLCAHRPQWDEGAAALERKAAAMREMIRKVEDLHRQGMRIDEIDGELFGTRGVDTVQLLSAGDISTRNLIRSILYGPVVRPELVGVLGAGSRQTGASVAGHP